MLPPDRSHVVAGVPELKALSSDLRQKLLAQFCGEPMTTKQAARALGQAPTKLYHHMEILEGAGLIRLVETRPNRGTTEKYFQAIARTFLVGDQTLGAAPRGIDESFAEAFRKSLAEIRGLLKSYSPEQATHKATLAKGELRLTPEEFVLFRDKLQEFISFFAESPSPDGKPHSVLLALYEQPKGNSAG